MKKKNVTLMLQVILSDSLQLAHCLENCREGIHLNNLKVSPRNIIFEYVKKVVKYVKKLA